MLGRGRERKALYEAIDHYGAMVYRLAYRVLRNQNDAEDVAQEVFVKLLRARRASTLACSNPKAWLSVTTLNTARKALRSEANRRKREELVAFEKSRVHPSPCEPPDDAAEVWRIVDGLAEDLRTPLVLHYQEGFKYREIAAALGCPEGTVATRISTAKARVRTILEKSGGLPSCRTSKSS